MFATDSSSAFLDHLFEVIDINQDDSLNFLEFLRMCCTFCCYTEVEMVKFAFDTFDLDGSGEIGVKELSAFIAKLESRTGDIPKTVKRVLLMFDKDADHSLGIDEFAEMNLKYPHLLWPAFRLQYRVQEVTLGLSQWKLAQNRMKEKVKKEQQAKHLHPTHPNPSLCCLPFHQPPPPPPEDSDSGITGRDPSRKLNPDRIRHKESKNKQLSVMRSRRSGGVKSRSQMSGEMSMSGRTGRSSRQQGHGGTGEGGGRPSQPRGRLGSPQHWMSASGDSEARDDRREEREDEGKVEGEGSESERTTGPSRTLPGGSRSSASVHPAPGGEVRKATSLRGAASTASTLNKTVRSHHESNSSPSPPLREVREDG